MKISFAFGGYAMNHVEDYYKQKELLMDEYENEVRQWLRKQHVKEDVVNYIPFFEDGVVCPERWFADGNEFRPLFILKEASIGIDNISELERYYEKWQSTKFDHVGDEFGDIRIGVNKFKGNNPWMRIVKLAYGLKNAYATGTYCACENVCDVSFVRGKENPNNISGDPIYAYATVNKNYISMVNQIAVVNIKKIAGGKTTKSELSKATKDYSYHLDEPLAGLLYRQIVELIRPTVIIYCSPDISYYMKRYMEISLFLKLPVLRVTILR